MIGIYCITNIINNKKYIGKSINIEERKNQHFRHLKNGTHCNNYLQNSFNKYGEKNFTFEVIEVTNEENLDEREIFYIDKYNTTNVNFGYNLTYGGEGGKLTEQLINQLKISSRGKNSKLTSDDVRKIKLCIYCLMDRKDIAKMFNISEKMITQIAMGKNFYYVNEELNPLIHNLKQNLIDERNKYIVNLHDKGLRNVDIINKTGYSISIVEKAINKYRNPQDKKRQERIKKYDEILNLFNNGYSAKEIQKITKYPRTTIENYINGRTNPHKEVPYKKVTKEIEDNIIKMYFIENITVKDISNKFNLSENTINDYINRHKYANTEITN